MLLDQPPTGSDWIAPDCAGMDFYTIDRGLRDRLAIYTLSTREPEKPKR